MKHIVKSLHIHLLHSELRIAHVSLYRGLLIAKSLRLKGARIAIETAKKTDCFEHNL